MDAAIIVTWSEPIPGREQKALDYGVEVQTYWAKKSEEGKCSPPEWFFFPNGHGLWMVKGERDTLLGEYIDQDSQRLTTKGGLLLQDFGCDFVETGPAADAHMLAYGGLVQEMSFA